MKDELKEMMDARVKKDPTNLSLYAKAAAAFASLGDLREARNYVNQALALEPGYRDVLMSRVPILFDNR